MYKIWKYFQKGQVIKFWKVVKNDIIWCKTIRKKNTRLLSQVYFGMYYHQEQISFQTERQIRITVQLTLLYDTRHRYISAQESYNRHTNISKLRCYWRMNRLNHVLTHFRQIYKTINTAYIDIQATA